MSGRVQRDLGSTVEGMAMGPGSAGGRITGGSRNHGWRKEHAQN